MNSIKKNLSKYSSTLSGSLKKQGFMRWRYFFSAHNKKTNAPKSFFIELIIVNPKRSPAQPIFGQLYEQKIKKHYPSYVMIKAGTWGDRSKQINDFYPSEKLKVNRKTATILINSIVFSHNTLKGSVSQSKSDIMLHPEYMSNAGAIAWDLQFKSYSPYCSSQNWYIFGTRCFFSGRLLFDNEEYIVQEDTSFGYCDKHQGKDFVNPIFGLTAHNLISKISGKQLLKSSFAINSGFTKTIKNNVPYPSVIFYYENVAYKFKKHSFGNKHRVQIDFKNNDDVLHWLVSAENNHFLLDIDVFCDKKATLFINYETPTGCFPLSKLWSSGYGVGELKLFKKINKSLQLLEHVTVENAYCEFGEYDMLDII